MAGCFPNPLSELYKFKSVRVKLEETGFQNRLRVSLYIADAWQLNVFLPLCLSQQTFTCSNSATGTLELTLSIFHTSSSVSIVKFEYLITGSDTAMFLVSIHVTFRYTPEWVSMYVWKFSFTAFFSWKELWWNLWGDYFISRKKFSICEKNCDIFFFLQMKSLRIFRNSHLIFLQVQIIFWSVFFLKFIFSCINIQRSWMYVKFLWYILIFEKRALE